MSEWIDCTKNPKKFLEIVNSGGKAFADFEGDVSLQWGGEQLLYVYPSKWEGEYESSLFPALFKSTDEDMVEVFAFWRELKKLNGE